MEVLESKKIQEKAYIETLKNGMKVIIVPKPNLDKKYIIWGTHFGSIDNRFIMPKTNEEVFIPDGVAHFLEHKMFEQPNGTNSLDTLMALGLDANAYTTNDHTAYLFECTDNFYEAMDELMDYVQHPYFTDENVEKEKGIIGQEISMYDDYPDWRVYLNTLEAMYHENPIKIDITGTIETISKIDKDILYKCYNTFYHPSNMAIVIAGDFKPEELLEEVKRRLIKKEENGEIKRIYPEEKEEIVKPETVQKLEVSNPIYTIGLKDVGKETSNDKNEIVKKHISIEILLNIIFGRSSKLYQDLYNEGIIYGEPSMDYEFGRNYAHVLITGMSSNPRKVYKAFKEKLEELKNTGVNKNDFERLKKMIYGNYVREYNDVQDIARMFLSDYFKGICSFDYLEEIESINVEYINQVLKDVFKEEKMVLSIVENE